MSSMRPLRLALVAALATLTCAPAAGAQQAEITGERRIKDRVLNLTIRTSAFSAPTDVEVFLPAGYDAQPGRRWPVTYFTAGTMNSQATFRTLVKGDELVRDYPAIVVSPDSNSGYWSDWYNSGTFGPPKYETFVIDELVPLIDARFRTYAQRSHRFVFGVSMGGYGAMMLAARHPDVFAAAASLSGAVDSNLPANGAVLSASSTFDGAPADAIYGPRAEQEIRWRGHNPADLAANLRGLDLQVRGANGTPAPQIGENPASADGVSCVVEGGTYMASVSFHRALAALGVDHVWRDYGPGCHSPANFTREVTDTLKHFERLLPMPPAAPANLDHRSIRPRFDVFGWTVQADAERALEWLEVQGSRATVTLTGSGRTAVTTPAWYRGLAAVDVAGRPVAPGDDGRLRFEVDLGPAHTVQQLRPGAATTMTTRTVTLSPHAAVRVAARRGRRQLLVCLRAVGGDVRDVRVTAGARTLPVQAGRRTRCRGMAARAATVVKVRGTDAAGRRVAVRVAVAGR